MKNLRRFAILQPGLMPLVCVFLGLSACGDDDDPPLSEAQRRGVGAACAADTDCVQQGQSCLSFKGGYCGVENCTANANCPPGSACVAHDDGKNYCFLICTDKPQCNLHRPLEFEANCSSNVTFVEATTGNKACVPPS